MFGIAGRSCLSTKRTKITAKFIETKTVKKQLQGGKKQKFKLRTARIISRTSRLKNSHSCTDIYDIYNVFKSI